MSKITKIILTILVSLIVFAGIILGYLFARKEYEIRRLPSYYHELAQDCKQKENFGCCIASVNNMVGSNSKIKPENGCPNGFQINTLKCIDSYTWCEPLDKESNQLTCFSDDNLPEKLFKHWVSSDEENTKDFKIFRPNYYNFPLSRFPRQEFEIKKDGEFVLYLKSIQPDDRVRTTEFLGFWKVTGQNKITGLLKYKNDYHINILSCNNDILKIVK